MNLADNKVKQILLEQNYITEENIKGAEDYTKSHDVSFIDYLFLEDIMTKDIFGQAMGEYFKVPYLNLSKENIDEKIFNLIPEVIAKNKGVVAINRSDKGVIVGMLDPDDLATLRMVEKRVGDKVIPYFIIDKDFKSILSYYRSNIKEGLVDLFEKIKKSDIEKEEKDSSIVKIVDLIIELGHQSKTSDIHIEPYSNKIVIRFRIDGVLHDILDVPKELSELILSRIKILAKMRTDEHRAAQDGKIKFKIRGEYLDVRVSIVPVPNGENVVMRLLSAENRQYSLTDIGLSNRDLQKVRKGIKNPHGMILVTGPTGSGKTTTLYSVMKILNKREVHISTIEDPVEYDIESITQIQVNNKTNLTFAKGLRAIVRQDPDIIMVGEIRDEETASIAVNSALTGHLVLSTLHTNDAPTSLPRLLDMNIEPFLVASTVNVVIAQRLVRKICSNCRMSYQLGREELDLFKNDQEIKKIIETKAGKKIEKISFYKSPGCNVCSQTGFVGRVGVFEVLEVNEEIKKLIVNRSSSNEIMKEARRSGMTTMFEDGVEKVLGGVTTLNEVLRVSKS